jgi:hypothetical protein
MARERKDIYRTRRDEPSSIIGEEFRREWNQWEGRIEPQIGRGTKLPRILHIGGKED